MFEKLTNTWNIFFALVFGLFLLMISVRPELQPRRGHEHAAGPTIEIVGHTLTWSTGTILVYRMAQGAREQARIDREQANRAQARSDREGRGA